MTEANLYDLDVDAFITEVHKYPEIWNTMSEHYNDRVKKRNAWIKISAAVCEDFNSKNIWEKNDIDNILIKKWRNIKDNYIKSLKKRKRSKLNKEYMYARQLSFLKSTITPTTSNDNDGGDDGDDDDQLRNADSIKSEDNDDTDPDLAAADPLVNDNGTEGAVGAVDYILPNHDSDSRKRRRQNSEDSRISISKSINPFEVNVAVLDEPKVTNAAAAAPTLSTNGDRAFFESLLPALKDFDEDEKLEFRADVLDLVRKMRKRKRTD